ncbi:MAG TPA: META domain-containing protein [Steroidobacteraceae bacterium]|nr:META domain-containing protein [Steroidobacteraceae bacterium]
MKTSVVKILVLLLCAIPAAAFLTTSCATSPDSVRAASTLPLLNTSWRLTQLGDEVIDNPAGERAVNFLLQPSSTNLVGFSGCNRMFGRYALEGPSLKFDGLGGTRMFCEAQMPLEQRFLAMFSQVSGWEISGSTLRLLDANGKTAATFNTP